MADRLLLIADDSFDAVTELPDELCKLVSSSDHVRVVAPTTGSRLETLTEDEGIYEEARTRADRVARLVRGEGADVEAQTSESAPLESATAALSGGDYDAVVVITTSEGHWRENGLLEDLRSATDVPVHAVRAD